MVRLDTPITTDDRSFKKVLMQKQPAIVLLHHGRLDAALENALRDVARQHAGALLVVRIDVSENPDAYAQYDRPATPALVALSEARFGRKVVATAPRVRAQDIAAYADHLLKGTPLPQPTPASRPANGAAPRSNGSASDSAPGEPVTVTDRTFRQEVLKSKVPVLVDFWADWCGPCRMVAPYIDELARDYAGRLKVAKLDTDRNPVISRRYEIRSIPTFIVFQGGQPVARISGANPAAIRSTVRQIVGA